MKPKPWSHSSLDKFVNCPRQFHAVKIEKSVIEPESPQMRTGLVVHKHFEDRQGLGKVPLPSSLAVHEPFMRQLEDLPGEGFPERKVALSRAGQPCSYFDPDVWWRGVIDYVKVHRKSALIVDYKTGKPHQKYSQLKICALHTFAEFPEVDTIRVAYYWTQTQDKSPKTLTRDQVPQLWQEFLPNLKQYVEAFRTDTWQPRPSGLCHGWCPVRDCEFWKPPRTQRPR